MIDILCCVTIWTLSHIYCIHICLSGFGFPLSHFCWLKLAFFSNRTLVCFDILVQTCRNSFDKVQSKVNAVCNCVGLSYYVLLPFVNGFQNWIRMQSQTNFKTFTAKCVRFEPLSFPQYMRRIFMRVSNFKSVYHFAQRRNTIKSHRTFNFCTNILMLNAECDAESIFIQHLLWHKA